MRKEWSFVVASPQEGEAGGGEAGDLADGSPSRAMSGALPAAIRHTPNPAISASTVSSVLAISAAISGGRPARKSLANW